MDNVSKAIIYTNCVNITNFLLFVSVCGCMISQQTKWKVVFVALCVLSTVVAILLLRALESLN